MMNSSLMYITQSQKLDLLQEETKRILDYGIDWVQLRIKNYQELDQQDFLGFYEKCGEVVARIIEEYSATFIINDNTKLCLHLNADGVHLGKKDMDLEEARSLLNNKIIGATANDWNDIENAQSKSANYIGLGPLRHTDTKKDLSPVLGFDGYQKLFQNVVKLPVYAIGGVQEADCEQLKNIGLSGVAVSSLIYQNGSEKLVKKINEIFQNKS